MGAYDDDIATALELLEEFGETSTIARRVAASLPDEDEPWHPGAPDETTYAVSAVWLDWDVERIAAGLVKAGDQRVLVGPETTSGVALPMPDPSVDRIVRADGAEWAIVGVKAVQPAAQAVLYELQVRQ